jgi:sugar phosphate permease
MQMGGALANAFAPVLIVPIALAFGWRTPFFAIAFLGIVWVLVCIFWFRNNPSEKKTISREEKEYIEQNRRLEKHRHHLSWKAFVENRNLQILPLCYFCGMFGWNFFIYWLPIYIQEGLHFSEKKTAMITSFIYTAGAFSALVAGIASDSLVKRIGLKGGRRFVGILSLSIAGTMFFLAAISIDTNSVVVVTCLFSALFFIISNTISSWSICIDIGGNNVGSVAGIMNTGGQIGGILVALIVGKLVSHSFTAPLNVLGAVLVGGSLLWLFIDPTRKVVTEKENAQFYEMASGNQLEN